MIYGNPAPWALLRWEYAEAFGWSLEYIDSLALSDIFERSEILDAKNKVREHYEWLKK